MFKLFLIFVFESLNFTLFTLSLEGVQICKRCWKTERFAGPEGFFWRTLGSL